MDKGDLFAQFYSSDFTWWVNLTNTNRPCM